MRHWFKARSAVAATRAHTGRRVNAVRGITSIRSVTGITAAAGTKVPAVVVAPARGIFGGRGFAASAAEDFKDESEEESDEDSDEYDSDDSDWESDDEDDGTPSRTWSAPVSDYDDDGINAIQRDLLEKYLSEDCMSAEELNKIALQKARAEFARHETDCGSTEVQVAILSTKILYMIEHQKRHRKDHHSRRGLQMMLNQRRKLLRYLRRTNGDRYGDLILRLGLRDNFGVEKGIQHNKRY